MIENPIQVNRETEYPERNLMESLTLEEVKKGIVSLIHQGGWSKADLFLVQIKGYHLVLKDFSRKSIFIRFLGRLQIWRESRAYSVIQGIPGIPKFYKKLNNYSFILEYVEGVRLAIYKGDVPLKRLLDDLKVLISAIHRLGVFHNDIRGRENIVVRNDGRLMLLDFAGAIYFKPGGFLFKMLSPLFRWIDYSAYLKWKSHLTQEDMEEGEEKSLKRFNFIRKFWIFNIKRKNEK